MIYHTNKNLSIQKYYEKCQNMEEEDKVTFHYGDLEKIHTEEL